MGLVDEGPLEAVASPASAIEAWAQTDLQFGNNGGRKPSDGTFEGVPMLALDLSLAMAKANHVGSVRAAITNKALLDEPSRSTFNAAIFVKQGKHVTCIYRREVSRMTSSPLAYTCAIWCMHRFTLLAQLSASMLLLHS